MLAVGQRLRRRDEFAVTMRTGRKAGRGGLVVHVLRRGVTDPARVGFVVPRAVGNAVVRNRVRRRLRHLLRARLAALPSGTDVVVRVLPAAATVGYDQLGADLDQALTRARRPAAPDRRGETRDERRP